MITTSLPLDLRLVLLETLCDLRRTLVSPVVTIPTPRHVCRSKKKARVVLRRNLFGFSIDNLDLSPTLLLAVKKTLLEIGEPKS